MYNSHTFINKVAFTRGQKINTYAEYMERIICIGVVYQSMLENLKWERALKRYVKMIQMNYSFIKIVNTISLTVYTELNAQKTSAMIMKVHIEILYY